MSCKNHIRTVKNTPNSERASKVVYNKYSKYINIRDTCYWIQHVYIYIIK